MGIKVRATQLGFYKGRRRRPGIEFEVDNEKQVSAKWMEVLSAPKSVKGEKTKAPDEHNLV